MGALGAAADELEDVLGVADLDGVGAEAVVLAGGLAPLAGALAGAAVAGLDLLVVGAEGELVAVLVEVLAGGVVRAIADELPLVGDVADLDASVGGGAPVGAEGAGLGALRGVRGSSKSRGGENKGGSDELHFDGGCWVVLVDWSL